MFSLRILFGGARGSLVQFWQRFWPQAGRWRLPPLLAEHEVLQRSAGGLRGVVRADRPGWRTAVQNLQRGQIFPN